MWNASFRLVEHLFLERFDARGMFVGSGGRM